MEAYCRKFEKYRKFEEAKKKNHPDLVTQKQPLLRKFVIIYSFFFLFLFFPLEYVFKILKMCRTEPGQENAMASWKTQCFTEVLTQRRKGRLSECMVTGCW